MYNQEFKNKILHLLKQKTVKEVAQEFNISSTTLYRWSKAKEDSKLIKNFIETKNYVEAIELAKKYPNDTLIQNQLITIYIKREEYEKAEEKAKKYPNYAPIQSQLITIYIKREEYEKAEEIAKHHPNYAPIQSQLITTYIKREEYEKAEEIAKKYPNNTLIQSQLITIYIRKGEYSKAEEIARKYPNHASFQSQLVTIYIKKKEYEKAEEIARKYPNDAPIQSQLVTIYIEREEYEKAEKIAKKYPNYIPIQSQLITIYIRKGEYSKAEETAKKYPNNTLIQSQLITIYIRKGEYSKAEEIAKKYPNDTLIQKQLVSNNNKKESEKTKATLDEISNLDGVIIKKENQNFPKEIGEIRNKISKGIISAQDLENLEKFKQKIGLENYLLITMAVYEKLGLSNMCKRLLKQDKILDVKLKSQLMTYFEQKNKIYNLEKWDNLIGWFNEQENFIEEVPDNNIEALKAKEIDTPVKNSNISKKMVIVTPSKVGEISEKKNIKNKTKAKAKTLKDILNKPSKELILDLKIKYYKEMHDLEKRETAIYKYDRLEEILSSEPSIKNFDSLLLLLIGDGNDKEKVEQSIPEQYSDEYKKVLNRINSRKKH